LLLAVLGGFGFLLSPFIFPGLGNFLDVVPIGNWWIGSLIVAGIMIIAIERYKNAFSDELHGTEILAEIDE
jgi:hypothetical protein